MHKFFTILVIAVFGNVYLKPLPAENRLDNYDSLRKSITKLVEESVSDYIEKSTYPSANVSIVIGDSLILSEGYGWEDETRTVQVKSSTVFNIASVSKVFVSVAIMQLVEDGKIKLHEPVNKYFTNIQLDSDSVTVWNLITHTSGLDVMMNDTQPTTQPLMSMEDYFRKNLSEIVFKPGDQINYSNHGMALAGHLVEVISGLDFASYVDKHIFKPLNMENSTFDQPIPDKICNRFKDERFDQNEWVIPYPSATMVSSAADMSKFMSMLLTNSNNQVLSKDSKSKLLSRQYSPTIGMPGLGLSFFESEINGYQVFYHTGSKDHFAIIALVPEINLGIFAALEADHGGSELRQKLVNNIIRKCFPKLDTQFTEEFQATSPSENLHEYEGDYRFNLIPQNNIRKLTGLISDLTIELGIDGFLIADGTQEIRQFDKDMFRTSDGSYLYFRRDADDKIENLFVNSPLHDSVSLRKLNWWEYSHFHIIIIASAILLIVISCIRLVFLLIKNLIYKTGLYHSKHEQILWVTHTLTLLSFILIPATIFVMIMNTESRTDYRLSQIISLVQVEIYITFFFVLLCLTKIYQIWVKKLFEKTSRIYYAIFYLIMIPFIWSLIYWNVLF
ncbi:MAG: serine hydrolase domain-containing protein [Fulvivirga sp.]|uniref:serine hydrolase domain-containing protein n=1 Tax=Fulvivirga sp. TaxID=1931237 RepID=UPI0032EDA62E